MIKLLKKIKEFVISNQKDLLVVSIIILVALGAFSLGRISAVSEIGEKGITFKQTVMVPFSNQVLQNTASAINVKKKIEIPTLNEGGQFVASKNGGKYYFPWCSGTSRIKDENKIWFATEDEAKKAGYGPAANCAGLTP